MKVKKSDYSRIVYMRDNEWLVHNLCSGSECVLDDQEIKMLSECNNQDFEVLPEFLSQLLNMGIIVLEETDEKACLELERRISLYSFATNEVGFVIAPTMDCNAQCFYCYENDTRKACYMDERTASDLVAYIKKTAKGKKKLYISWFGGEPLLCIDLIRSISAELIEFCDQNGIDYSSELTTNGYYLDLFIEDLKRCKIADTQITLDGFREEYLKRKNFIGCKDAWKKVTDNIFAASNSGNHITIRLNFDKNNINSIKQCTDFLISDPRWNEEIVLYYYPLESDCSHHNSSVISFYEESEYESVMNDLYEYLYQRGYYTNRKYALDFHKLSLPCYGATLGVLAVDYEGKLYQCQHLLCKTQYAIGDVKTGVPVTRSLIDWYDGTIPSRCESCEVLPLCQGGCVTKPRIGLDHYVCHMMKYRLKIQEILKVREYLKQESE